MSSHVKFKTLTDTEFLILKENYYQFLSYKEIGIKLNKSKTCICYHINKYIELGYLIKIPKTKNPEKLLQILKNHTKTVKELCQITNQNQDNIKASLKLLKKYSLLPKDYKIIRF